MEQREVLWDTEAATLTSHLGWAPAGKGQEQEGLGGWESLTGTGCTPGICAGPEIPDAALADWRADGVGVAVGWAWLAGPLPREGLEGALGTG